MDRDTPAERHFRRIAMIARRLQRPQARVRQSTSVNMLTSFGMAVGLLMVWAMAVNM